MKIIAFIFAYLYSVVSGFSVLSITRTTEANEIQEKYKFKENIKSLTKDDHLDFTEEASLNYLQDYGYLPVVANGTIHNVFSKTAAVLAFQKFANLPETGVIDEQTVRKMKQRRCGVMDIHSKLSNYKMGPSKWNKNDLTYRITKFTKDLPEKVQRSEIAKAFQYWSDVTPLKFKELTSGEADIMIKFVVKDHGDGYEFDGKGNILAHAFYPENGDAHYDDDETWTSESTSGINLLAVATHEFGHSLGLDHSNIDTAIMAPFYNGYQKNLKLDKDDIEAIQKWYGKKVVPDTTTATATTTTTTAAATTTTAAATTPTLITTTSRSSPSTKPTLTTTTMTSTKPITPTTTTAPTTTSAPTTSTNSVTTTIPTTTITKAVSPLNPSPTSTAVTTTTKKPMLPKFPPHDFPCPFKYGAIMTDEKDKSIGFYGSYLVYIDENGKVDPGRHRINSIFPGGPSYVHASAYDPKTKATFLFSYSDVWKYVDGKLAPNFPKYLGIFPLAAMIEDGQLMVLTTSYIYHLDKNTMHWSAYPVNIRSQYPGVPYYFRAAISYGHGYVYFFRWRKIYELDIYTGEISQMDC